MLFLLSKQSYMYTHMFHSQIGNIKQLSVVTFDNYLGNHLATNNFNLDGFYRQ